MKASYEIQVTDLAYHNGRLYWSPQKVALFPTRFTRGSTASACQIVKDARQPKNCQIERESYKSSQCSLSSLSFFFFNLSRKIPHGQFRIASVAPLRADVGQIVPPWELVRAHTIAFARRARAQAILAQVVSNGALARRVWLAFALYDVACLPCTIAQLRQE